MEMGTGEETGTLAQGKLTLDGSSERGFGGASGARLGWGRRQGTLDLRSDCRLAVGAE